MKSVHAPLKLIKEKPLVAIIPVFVGICWFCYWFFYSRYFEYTDNAYIRGNITPISAKISGYIESISADDGTMVEENTALISISPKEYEEQKNKSFGELKEIASNLDQIKIRMKLSELDIDKAKSRFKKAKAEYDRAKSAHDRSVNLIKNDIVSKEKMEEQTAALATAKSLLEEAETDQEHFKLEQSNMELEYQKLEQIYAARKASLELAEINLKYTKITAPAQGIVGNRSCRIGQFIYPGMILMYVVPLDNVWVIANFKETQVSSMKIGQKALIEVDAFPKVIFEGKIEAIAPASGAEFSLLPPDNATGNFTKIVQRIPVKISITKKDGYRIIPGMSAYAKVCIK